MKSEVASAIEGTPGQPSPAVPYEHSLNSRYAYKLGVTLMSFASGALIQALVPRALGPVDYGNFSYLTNFFSRLTGFASLGTAIPFYNSLCKRPDRTSVISFYAYFIAGVCLFTLLSVGACYALGVQSIVWPDQQWIFVLAAAFLGPLIWASDVVNKVADAYAFTVRAEQLRLWQKAVGVILVFSLFFAGGLTLGNFFLYNFVIVLFVIVLWILLIRKAGKFSGLSWTLSRQEWAGYGNEFWKYSKPLLAYSAVGFGMGVLDRWLLQVFGGSAEQGFFGLSYQIGAVCFAFAGAMTPLILREFSIAFSKNDIATMAALFRRYIPGLYSMVACLSCFMAVEAKNVVAIFGGEQFAGAILPVTIMAFYPIHQTYGQLSGAMFFATEQLALYRNIGIAAMLMSVPLTFWLVGPAHFGGLDGGATGLAVKTISLQVVVVNIQLFFNARMLKLPLSYYFGHQLLSVACLLGLALASKDIVDRFMPDSILQAVVAAGLLYMSLAALLAYRFPSVFGIDRKDVDEILRRITNLHTA